MDHMLLYRVNGGNELPVHRSHLLHQWMLNGVIIYITGPNLTIRIMFSVPIEEVIKCEHSRQTYIQFRSG